MNARVTANISPFSPALKGRSGGADANRTVCGNAYGDWRLRSQTDWPKALRPAVHGGDIHGGASEGGTFMEGLFREYSP